MYGPCDWLEDIVGPSNTHETGTTVVPGSCERGLTPARSLSVTWQSPAIGAARNSPAAEHWADYGQVGEKGWASYGPSLLSRPTSSAVRLRRPARHVTRHCFERLDLGPSRRVQSECNDKRRPSATDVADYMDPETAVIVRPTGPGPPVVFVSGCVDVAVSPAGLGTGLQDDGHVANVGGYASRLSIACRELASTVVDSDRSPVISPGVIRTDIVMILWRLN